MKKRLFIAIPLPESQKEILSSCREKNSLADARWTTDEKLHITAYFCGDIEESKIPEMNTSLKDAAANMKPFKLDWKGLVFAPPKRPPRMVWAEYEGNKEFTNMVHAIYNSIKDFLDPSNAEKPHPRPIPHVTMARFRNPGTAKEIELDKPQMEPLNVKSFELMASELTPDGSIYTVQHKYEIK
jgi:2'-5' RNA ligase